MEKRLLRPRTRGYRLPDEEGNAKGYVSEPHAVRVETGYVSIRLSWLGAGVTRDGKFQDDRSERSPVY